MTVTIGQATAVIREWFDRDVLEGQSLDVVVHELCHWVDLTGAFPDTSDFHEINAEIDNLLTIDAPGYGTQGYDEFRKYQYGKEIRAVAISMLVMPSLNMDRVILPALSEVFDYRLRGLIRRDAERMMGRDSVIEAAELLRTWFEIEYKKLTTKTEEQKDDPSQAD